MIAAAPGAFVMADIAGSSRLWNREARQMSAALARHDEIADVATRRGHGEVFKHTGDGFLARFDDVAGALAAMQDYQNGLAHEAWPEPITIRSRVGIHWGPAEGREGDWFGPTVNHLARLTDLVEPTHVVASGAALGACVGLAAGLLEPLGSFSIRDVPEPVALFALPVESARGPALTVEAGRGLPQFPTALVGRDADIAEVLTKLDAQRVVTLVGFGGTGKTRLAVEIGHRWVARAGRAAQFVDLTSDDDPVAALADAIGLPASKLVGELSPYPAIAKHLGNEPVLIVMDNCEHVIDDAAAACAELRDSAPAVTILATSREPLELAGETVHQLTALEHDDATHLLRHLATLAHIPDPEPATVDRLVAAVDGLPLGIELVVARLRHVSAPELADALQTDLDALRGRRRSRERGAAAPSDRHETLRTLIEWSYDLLDADERTLLLRLSRLHAPWTRDTAAGLTPELDPHMVEELVAKSLVSMDRNGTFRMLESVRQFCGSVLDRDSTAADAADHALVDWALEFAPPVTSAAGLVFDPQRTRELNDQAPNLQAALAAAARQARHEDRAGVVTGLWPLVVDVRARRWFDTEVLHALESATAPAVREVLIRLAFQGQVGEHVDVDRQQHLVEQLTEIDPERASPVWGVVTSGEAVGEMIAAGLLGTEQAPIRKKLDHALDVARQTNHTLDLAITGLFLAFSHLLDGHSTEARRDAIQAADWGRACNFVPLIGLAEAAHGFGQLLDGEWQPALDTSTAALPLGEHARWESSIRVVHIVSLVHAGQPEVARIEAAALIDFVLDDMNPFLVFDAVTALAALDTAQHDLGEARAALEQSSVPRTPLTTAVLLRAAEIAEFDLGVDRFVDVFDPASFVERSERAANYLRSRQLTG